MEMLIGLLAFAALVIWIIWDQRAEIATWFKKADRRNPHPFGLGQKQDEKVKSELDWTEKTPEETEKKSLFDFKPLRILMGLGMAVLSLFCLLNVWVFVTNDNNIIIKIVLVVILCPLAIKYGLAGVIIIFKELFGKAIGLDDED